MLDILGVQEKDLYKMSFKLPKIFPQKTYSAKRDKKFFSGKAKALKKIEVYQKEVKEKYGSEKPEKKYNTKERMSAF